MVFNFLDELKRKVCKKDFEVILDMVTDDIKFNRVKFNKRTSPKEFITICNSCYIAITRCNGGVLICR
ncbi:hypothetical protein [Clostridium sp. BJN0001]|uniref:hypothetical protein n=1 Tax=Clostridium sp. BJN0001 TaxID=2930219 RepID=UPI001FCF9DD4|nr:hypothetical protein [Clostridium sp. BJN0001]